MDAARIQARAVVKVAAISLAVIAAAAAARDRRPRRPHRDPLGLRGAVPGARPEPRGRPDREPPGAGPPGPPALAGDPGRLRDRCSASSSSWSSRSSRRSSTSSSTSGSKVPGYVTRLPAVGQPEPAVPGPEPQVRHHPDSHPAGVDDPLQARRRGERRPERHRQRPRAPAGRDHDPRPDLLPAPRRPPAGRAACSRTASTTPPCACGRIATRIAGRGQGLRHGQPRCWRSPPASSPGWRSSCSASTWR